MDSGTACISLRGVLISSFCEHVEGDRQCLYINLIFSKSNRAIASAITILVATIDIDGKSNI